jgi:acid phosphatase
MVRTYLIAGAALTALVLLNAPGEPVGVRADEPHKTAEPIAWPNGLPVYDHVVIVVEENKDYAQIVNRPDAPFINELRETGANFTRMFGEEHFSPGNYFWMFSGDNQGVGFRDGVPDVKVQGARNLGASLIRNGLKFKGYSEELPKINSEAVFGPEGVPRSDVVYARKHVPWISFDNVPNNGTAEESSNLRFEDFATDFTRLPTVAFVIPNLSNDMHNTDPAIKNPVEARNQSVRRGDRWLRDHLGGYARWARTHNSLLIVTFDECDDPSGLVGLTDPFLPDMPTDKDARNQI